MEAQVSKLSVGYFIGFIVSWAAEFLGIITLLATHTFSFDSSYHTVR